ncbi:serine/threonine-protein kinase [Polyangium mundeleinium]|uniref:Serine/threonine-protein kinase n=1 Tax=Polyangium mundeleinium TaxID=2995306 RepID=A0ABT5EZV1_9BACT|nr:serine/threonine-protein kinase [Polyangium mundeleinium]MDC0746442.1 serine/threonine-protein kinase [Polyangium mundeleinium]
MTNNNASRDADPATRSESVDSFVRKVARAPAMQPPVSLEVGAIVDDAFRVERTLGRGGMGIVFLARDIRLDRPVALKLLRFADARAEKFMLREARVLARCTHPNVVTIYEVGTHAGQVFLAMEYVDAGTLRSWLNERPRSWQEILDKFLQAARGLAAAHMAGLVHHDFKPDNVLIGKDARVRVADFGLARVISPQMASEEEQLGIGQSHVPAGTPAYASPEQRTGMTDARSDQYSYCVALREALTGIPRVPSRIRRIIARGFEEDPSRRWESMEALATQLELARRSSSRRFWALGITIAMASSLGLVALRPKALVVEPHTWTGTTYDGSDADLGATADLTCFLTGLFGDLEGADWTRPARAGLYEDPQTMRWRMEVDSPGGAIVHAESTCIDSAAGYTGVKSWDSASNDSHPTLLAAVTPRRQCFLTEIIGVDGLESELDDIRVWHDGQNWWLGGSRASSGKLGLRAYAACMDIGREFTSGNLEGQAAPLKNGVPKQDLPPDATVCFLAGVGGRFRTNELYDGAGIRYDKQTKAWQVYATKGKRLSYVCIK